MQNCTKKIRETASPRKVNRVISTHHCMRLFRDFFLHFMLDHESFM